mgnify:CR=1 FL=1
MFYGFQNLQSIDFTNFNGNNVTECYRMFENCINLTTVNGINFPNCNNFRAAFSTCTSLTYFPIKPENFKDDTTYRYIYGKCYNIAENISNINISNCELYQAFTNTNISSINNISLNNCILNKTFYNCPNLKYIDNIKFSNCDLLSVFDNCCNLLNITNINISNINNMFATFLYCNSLTDIAYLDTSNVTNLARTFCRCNNLSNSAIQNIINMCLNSNVTNNTLMNLGTANVYSPLYQTKFDSSYYSNRLTELTQAGWSY